MQYDIQYLMKLEETKNHKGKKKTFFQHHNASVCV